MENGTPVDGSRYRPFGSGGALSSKYGYTARELVAGDVYYYRARYYDAFLGRFVSEDPLGYEAGINSSAYAFGDPIKNADPMGLAPSAHVCCDGNGGFTICWDVKPQQQIFVGCMEAHEKDHIDFMTKNPGACPGQCKDPSGKPRPAGWNQFEMAPDERNDMECRGYQTEIKCLMKNIGQALSKSDVLFRVNMLKAKAKQDFKCDTANW